jgi:hypothetical protein
VRFRFVGGNFLRRSMSIFAVTMFVVTRCVAYANADSDVNGVKNFLERVARCLSRRGAGFQCILFAGPRVSCAFAICADYRDTRVRCVTPT